MNLEENLKQANLELPAAPKPVAAYVPAMTVGNLVFISGQLPMKEGSLSVAGKVPSQVSVEEAQEGARICLLNALAVLKAELGGSFDRLVRAVRVGAFVQSDDDFSGQPQVANGASEMLVKLLGDAGKHVRAAVGTNALPLNAAVEIEFVFEVMTD